jgi:hypothetical protein
MWIGEALLALVVLSVIPITFWLSDRFKDAEHDARKMADEGRKPYGRTSL